MFKDESGQDADAQLTAFDDSWHWGPAAEGTFHHIAANAPLNVGKMIGALREFIGDNQMMAYLVMMAARLVELHRVLKPTGSLYLHCDPTASHYLKVLLDSVFGFENFKNEILWKRKTGRGDTGGTSDKFGNMTDVLLFYGKGQRTTFHQLFRPNDPAYLEKFFKFTDEKGRRFAADNLASPSPRPNLTYEYKGYKPPAFGWAVSREKMMEMDSKGMLIYPKDPKGRIRRKRFLDDLPGEPVQNIWDDISPLSALHAERLGYPTQKPLSLLERIIEASSNPGDVVMDPFSGCGTAIAAAQKLGRQWIGIDITHLAINMHKYRLKDMFGLTAGKDYQVIGEPTDLAGAQQLAREDRYQFQWWALSLIGARPAGGVEGSKKGKKGSDKGIDGLIPFIDDSTNKIKYVVVQVKSGKVNSGYIRDLRGTLDREDNSPMAVFITLEPATSEMIKEAVSTGFYTSPLWQRDYPKIQILSIEELLSGTTLNMPATKGGFKEAPKVKPAGNEQPPLRF